MSKTFVHEILFKKACELEECAPTLHRGLVYKSHSSNAFYDLFVKRIPSMDFMYSKKNELKWNKSASQAYLISIRVF